MRRNYSTNYKDGGKRSSVRFSDIICPATAVPMAHKYFYLPSNFLNGLFHSIQSQALPSYGGHWYVGVDTILYLVFI